MSVLVSSLKKFCFLGKNAVLDKLGADLLLSSSILITF